MLQPISISHCEKDNCLKNLMVKYVYKNSTIFIMNVKQITNNVHAL